MLQVSTQWQKATREQFRRQAYLYVTLEVVPPGLRDGATATSEDTNANASTGRLLDGIAETPAAYASLERNRWTLDGTFLVRDSGTLFDDWWSKVSVSDGTPVVKFTFDQPYTFPGMYFRWDKVSGSYPTSIRVVGYNSKHVQKYSVLVNNINSDEGFFSTLAMNDIQYVDVEILQWVSTGWRARMVEVVFGLSVSFDSVNNGRILSATQTSMSDPLSRKLPSHSVKLKMRNYDQYFDAKLETGITKYLARQQVVNIQWAFVTAKGVVEYAPKQLYLVKSFEVPADSKEISIELNNRIEVLDNDFLYGTYTGSSRTLRALAEYVLTMSNVPVEFTGQMPWTMPDVFDTIATTAPIPYGAVNEILQLIALAGCVWLTTRGPDGFIQFMPYKRQIHSLSRITMGQELGDPEITIHDRLKSLSVGVYNYTPRSAVERIGTGEYLLTGKQIITLKYSVDYATEVSATVTGATLVSARYYASCAVLTVEAPAEESVVKVELNGKVIDSTVSYLETYRNETIADGRDIRIENPLVTTVQHAKLVAQYVERYYRNRKEYKIPYVGYPQVEPGDVLELSTTYGDALIEVKSNKIDFNGGWSGVIEGEEVFYLTSVFGYSNELFSGEV